MSLGTFNFNSALEDYEERLHVVYAQFSLTGSATLASIIGSTDNTGAVLYVYNGTQPTPTDSGANFGSLTSPTTGNSTVGLLVNCLDADPAFAPQFELVAGSIAGSGGLTGVTRALAGNATTGVTTLFNVAVVLTLTACPLNTAITQTFTGRLIYRRKPGK
jgi:hypothetical protein